VPPEHTRIRAHPVIASPPVSHDRWLHLSGTVAPLPTGAAATPRPAASVLIGELIPMLARLLEDALRAPATPLPLRIDLPATARPRGPADPQQLAIALAKAVASSGDPAESGRLDQAQGLPGPARTPLEAASMAAPPEARVTAQPEFLPRQLSWLATGELAFQFAAWPGQNVVLVFSRQPGQADHPAPPDTEVLARLELELPGLGPVQAILRHDDRGLDVALRTGEAAAADILEAGRISLSQSLDSAGLQVKRIAVSHDLAR